MKGKKEEKNRIVAVYDDSRDSNESSNLKYTVVFCGATLQIAGNGKRVMWSAIYPLGGYGEESSFEQLPDKIKRIVRKQMKDGVCESALHCNL